MSDCGAAPVLAVAPKRKYVKKAKVVSAVASDGNLAAAPTEVAAAAATAAATDGARKRKYHRRAPLKPAGFLTKLRKMVADDELADIVKWNAAGNGILILNEDAFVSVVFPKYGFKTTRYSTFTRQLNLYQFVRVHSGKGTAEYANPLFLRDDPEAEAVRVSRALPLAIYCCLRLVGNRALGARM